MAGIARPVVHGRRKQSTKVLRELIQMTAEKNWKIFRASRDVQMDATRLSALPSAVTINVPGKFSPLKPPMDVWGAGVDYWRETTTFRPSSSVLGQRDDIAQGWNCEAYTFQ